MGAQLIQKKKRGQRNGLSDKVRLDMICVIHKYLTQLLSLAGKIKETPIKGRNSDAHEIKGYYF